MLLSRVKPAVEQQQIKTNFNPNHKISFKDLIQKRDYTGALTILKFDLEKNKDDIELEQWIAYCYFHLGDYKNAMFIYKKLSEQIKTKQILANLSCCYFYLGMYPEADEVLQKSDFSEVKIRLQFHLAHKQSDEKKLMEFHELLADVVEDQLSLAAIHYLRSHYQEAIDLYKKLMMNNRKLLALNVYMALCYYKLDFYDVSQEILDVYIKKYPDSMIVLNLKACNVYRLYDGKAAEGELKNLIRKQIEVGQQLFNLVGSSSSECDTIPGRQCMASAFFLEGRYDEVNLYLNSIKSYFSNDDNFNFNFAQVKLALGEYKDAEDMYLQVKNNKIVENFLYISHLTHCFIMNKKPQLAWDLYLKMENSKDSIIILQSIANDCYKTNQFWHSAKAFDMLEKLDLLPEYWEGKRGACAGAFQQIVLGKHSNEQVADIIQLLRNSANSQVENMIRMIKKWAKNNKIIV
ncbi:intraflagellar transport protein 56 isoform X7 [Daktulosphaira vitifoliae]|uniref:intraflagellar transport protein 56 isoform X6 n=1 Tax=Daktulosphaira vitifoliae TaxID=58002 RepID=UPI0021A985DD|nr:intraflagellar transport protein 56 isoform X6 [Daktulosphaira vitifoliae]XP_050525441.1 intraflagellar transport protein 56 isoform X7 [Daktulosphaira vitifoliae]